MIDYGLNNGAWLRDRFNEVRAMNNESDRLVKISEIDNLTNPGQGGFYDHLGDSRQQAQFVKGRGIRQRSGVPPVGAHRFWRAEPRSGLADVVVHGRRIVRSMPLCGCTMATWIRVRNTRCAWCMVATCRAFPFVWLRMEVSRFTPTHRSPIRWLRWSSLFARAGTRAGTLDLEWTCSGRSGRELGRGCQVSEVWLIRVVEQP